MNAKEIEQVRLAREIEQVRLARICGLIRDLATHTEGDPVNDIIDSLIGVVFDEEEASRVIETYMKFFH